MSSDFVYLALLIRFALSFLFPQRQVCQHGATMMESVQVGHMQKQRTADTERSALIAVKAGGDPQALLRSAVWGPGNLIPMWSERSWVMV